MDTIENDDFSAQLRSLRLILGKNFRPISTETLASLSSIPLVSVRAVEAGRRKLNDKDRDNIKVLLGAHWDPQSHQWVGRWNNAPYTRAYFEQHSKHLVDTGILRSKNRGALDESLNILLANLGPKEAAIALLDLHYEILRIARERDLDPDTLETIRSVRENILAQIPRDMH